MVAARRHSRVLLSVLLVAVFLAACENPFDPLDKADEIRGLSYIDFSLTWDRWDSDPEADGVIITIEYFNEFNDSLSFHDKAHRVVVEFWTQGTLGGELNEEGVLTGGTPTNGTLIFSYPVEHSFSDDEIRIPKEAYEDLLRAAGLNLDGTRNEEGDFVPPDTVELFVIVRVFPPKAIPRSELVAFYSDQVVWEAPEAVATDEGTP